MLRKLFQEKKGDESKDRETFFKYSFDQFLNELGLNENEYIEAIRTSVKGHGALFVQRKCSEVFVNGYNKEVMRVHPANQDFSLCIDENQVAGYVVNYLTKNEAGQSRMLREVDKQCAIMNLSYGEKLKKFADALDQSREVSVQEIVYRLLGLPMTQFSRKVKYLSTTDCQKRDGLLKGNLEELAEGESIFYKSAIDYYEKRPDNLEELTLADFWSHYEVIYGKNQKQPDEADDDLENDEIKKSNRNKIQLKDDTGFIMQRKQPAVLRYYIDKENEYEQMRGMLLLFYPFRNEYREISSVDLLKKYDNLSEIEKEMIKSQMQFYQPHQSVIDNIENFIEDNKEDEDDHEEENESFEDMENYDDDIEYETTSKNNIEDFLSSHKEKQETSNLMDKGQLNEKIGSLKNQQRKYFDDILNRLMDGDFEINPFYVYLR